MARHIVLDTETTGLSAETGDRLIEIAASLGLLLVATGLYLVWPREAGSLRAMFVPRLAAKGRALWKSLHQVVGTWMSVILVLFLITGLAWAGIFNSYYWIDPASGVGGVFMSQLAPFGDAGAEQPRRLAHPAGGELRGVTGVQ